MKKLNIDEPNKIRIRKVSGLLIGIFAIITFLAVLSYFFTWKSDFSLLSNPEMMDRGIEVNNWAGKIGYKWAYFIVTQCFGLGAIAVVVLLAALSVRLFFIKDTFRMMKMTVSSLTAAMSFSLLFAYIGSLIGADSAFGEGLGGSCGAAFIAWCSNLVGSIATGIIILFVVLIWLMYSVCPFERWFVKAGEGTSKKTVSKSSDNNDSESSDNSTVNIDNEGDVDSSNVEETAPEVGFEESYPADELSDAGIPMEIGGVGRDGSDDIVGSYGSVDTVGTDGHFNAGGSFEVERQFEDDGPEQTDDLNPLVVNEKKVGVDTGVEIIKGDELSTDIHEELPRIDVRSEVDRYVFPSLDLLDDYEDKHHVVATEELERNNNKIRATLLNFKIQVEKVVACVGPTVTLYKITPAPGVKISAIRNVEEDIAVAMGARGVRVVTLANAVGIEVANDKSSIVPLKSLLNDDSFRESKYELPIAIGYTITQKVKTFDLTSAPHLLVAGATQQGKSVGLNVIIASLLYAKHPSELKFVFIDPKMVEFNAYRKLLRHYLAVLPTAANEEEEEEMAIVKQTKHADEILRSLCVEMDERYKLMSKTSANNIKLYNEKFKERHLLPTEGHHFMPYIVAVIDEYSDLVMSVSSSGESKTIARSITNSIIRLAQKGRAAGIHIIIATQRPSVDVITALIKTNFPMRIAFRTVTRFDSNVILDSNGAEKLIGKGDMLFYAGVEMERVQCGYVGMDEIYRITDFIGKQRGYHECCATPYYLPLPAASEGDGSAASLVDVEVDETFRSAAEMVVLNQQGSTSTLQRKLGMGYARAGRVMDQLEAAGIVGPQEGSKPRQVLVSDLAELEKILAAYDK